MREKRERKIKKRGMISRGIMDHVTQGRCHLNVTLIKTLKDEYPDERE